MTYAEVMFMRVGENARMVIQKRDGTPIFDRRFVVELTKNDGRTGDARIRAEPVGDDARCVSPSELTFFIKYGVLMRIVTTPVMMFHNIGGGGPRSSTYNVVGPHFVESMTPGAKFDVTFFR